MNNSFINKRLLNASEAAAYLGVGNTYFYNHIKESLNFVQIKERAFFDIRDLDDFIDSSKVFVELPSPPPPPPVAEKVAIQTTQKEPPKKIETPPIEYEAAGEQPMVNVVKRKRGRPPKCQN